MVIKAASNLVVLAVSEQELGMEEKGRDGTEGRVAVISSSLTTLPTNGRYAFCTLASNFSFLCHYFQGSVSPALCENAKYR